MGLETVQQGLEPGKRAAPLCLDYMYKLLDPSFTIQIHVSGHPTGNGLETTCFFNALLYCCCALGDAKHPVTSKQCTYSNV
jgi:hypothetical protein